MSSNWPGGRPSSPAEILPPENPADPRAYGRMPGYDGDPGPVPGPSRARGTRWASAPATYTLVGINCAVYIAMVLRGVSPTNPSVVRPGALGRQLWRLCACRAVVASAYCRLCARRHHPPGDQHVVPVESGVAGRAAARSSRGGGRLRANRNCGKPAQHGGPSRRLSAPALPAQSSGWPASSSCCSRQNCCPCPRRRSGGCARA